MSRCIKFFFLFGLFWGLSTDNSFADGPLKVFILVGQSNMQGHAHVRTLEHLAMNDETKFMRDQICEADGTPRVHNDVWISYLTDGGVRAGQLTTGFGANAEKIGPELTFGIRMQEQLDEPILIIKAAWGGKSINTDFRPPSAGPYVFPEEHLKRLAEQGKDVDAIKQEKVDATGVYYKLMIDHVQSVLEDIGQVYPDYDSGAGYEIAGFVWFQGWNDMVDSTTYANRDQPGGYHEYSDLLAHFIRDVRKDLNTDIPFVIGVMGVGGPVSEYGEGEKRYVTTHQNFRDAMAAPVAMDDLPNVVAVLTENCWDPELTRLRERESEIRREIDQAKKNNEISDDEAKDREQRLRSERFSDRELETLEKAISNAEYHYLGSARILGCIGNKFAEALFEFVKQ
ncbi:MAG: sialate O-acetylesterase [Pirellulaceae bacterium]